MKSEYRYPTFRDRGKSLEFRGLTPPFLLLLLLYWIALVLLFWILEGLGFPLIFSFPLCGMAAYGGSRKIRILSLHYGRNRANPFWSAYRPSRVLPAFPIHQFFNPLEKGAPLKEQAETSASGVPSRINPLS